MTALRNGSQVPNRLKAEFMKSLDYEVPEFPGLWEPDITYLPNGWGVAIASIGPELAAAMLATNRDDNRNKRGGVYGKYADDIRCRRWRLTHQGIAFDRAGRLCDGQHRLTACVDGGAPFPTLVFFGVGDNEEMAVLDIGAARSAADASRYVLGERVGPEAIATVRAFVTGGSKHRPHYTHSHILALIGKYRAAVSFMARAFDGGTTRTPPAPTRAAIARAYYHAEPAHVGRFAALLVETENPAEPRDDVIKILRQYLAHMKSRGSMMQREIYLKTQRAVAAYLSGERLLKLYASEEDLFPLPTDAQVADRDQTEDALAATTKE